MAVLAFRFPLSHEFLPLRLRLVGNLDFLSLNGLSRFSGALGAGLPTSPKPPTAGLPDS